MNYSKSLNVTQIILNFHLKKFIFKVNFLPLLLRIILNILQVFGAYFQNKERCIIQDIKAIKIKNYTIHKENEF